MNTSKNIFAILAFTIVGVGGATLGASLAHAADRLMMECKSDIVNNSGPQQPGLRLYRESSGKYRATFQDFRQGKESEIANGMECSPLDPKYPYVFNCYGPDDAAASNSLHGIELTLATNFAHSLNQILVKEEKRVRFEQSGSDFTFEVNRSNCVRK